MFEIQCKNSNELRVLHSLSNLIYENYKKNRLFFNQALCREPKGSSGPSGSFPLWATAWACWLNRSSGRKKRKHPEILLEPDGTDNYDRWEEQRDRGGCVRGPVRWLLHLFWPETTEWPELQEQAAGTWAMTSSSSLTGSARFMRLKATIANSLSVTK